VPSPTGAAPEATPGPASAAQQQPAPPVREQPSGGGFPGTQADSAGAGAPSAGEVPQFGSVTAEQQSLLHIPCPKGHILETPHDMLGQDAMCPFCQTQFRLRLEASIEHRKERDDNRNRREQKLGKAWLNWAIVIGVLVALAVILMIALAAAR